MTVATARCGSILLTVSVADLKKNYSNLDVEFDLWKGESDADPLIPGHGKSFEKNPALRMKARARWL